MTEAVPERNQWLWFMLADVHVRACAVFTVAMLLMPPEGLGVDLCPSRLVTRAPCPGCGMTRCGSNLARGQFRRAVQFHPLGPVAVPAIAALGILAVLPRRWRAAVRAALMRRAALLTPLYWLGVFAFVFFGVIRWSAVCLGLAHFPATWP
jgi:hypothetical protein